MTQRLIPVICLILACIFTSIVSHAVGVAQEQIKVAAMKGDFDQMAEHYRHGLWADGYQIRVIETEPLEPVNSWIGTDEHGVRHYKTYSRCRTNYWHTDEDPYLDESHSLETGQYGGNAWTGIMMPDPPYEGADFMREKTIYLGGGE